MQVEWSDEALTDRAAIVDYLLLRNPHAAKRILLRLIDATIDLAMFPNIGRVIDELMKRITRDHDHKAFEGWQKSVSVERNPHRVYDV